MFYKLKKDTFVRNYDDIGYITSTGIFNDRVVNGSGAVLLSVLSRKPQSLEQLVEKSSSIFSNVSIFSFCDSFEFFCCLSVLLLHPDRHKIETNKIVNTMNLFLAI